LEVGIIEEVKGCLNPSLLFLAFLEGLLMMIDSDLKMTMMKMVMMMMTRMTKNDNRTARYL
jgi:hypothetical protein